MFLTIKTMRTAIVILCGLLIISCATVKRATNTQVQLTKDVSLNLTPAPELLNGHGFLTQVAGQFSNQHQSEQHELLMQVEVVDGNLTMVGTTANGFELFQLHWPNNQTFIAKRSALAQKIEVEYLLADFQLVHWPLAILENQLDGGQISEQYQTKNAQQLKQTRQIKRQQRTLITIDYDYDDANNLKHIRFTNHHRHYQFELKLLDKWTL